MTFYIKLKLYLKEKEEKVPQQGITIIEWEGKLLAIF